MHNGIVNSVWTKNVKTRYGEKPVTLFSMDSEEGPFNLGFGRHDLAEGDDVQFNDNGDKYGEVQVDKGTLKINSRGNSVPKPTPKSSESKPASTGGGGRGYSRGTFPLEFTDGQRSILRQHAFTQASEVYRAHYGSNCMENGEWSPVESIDSIIELAYKIEKYTSGDDLREEMKE